MTDLTYSERSFSRYQLGREILAALASMELDSMVAEWPTVKIYTFIHQKMDDEECEQVTQLRDSGQRFAHEKALIDGISRYSNYSRIHTSVSKRIGPDAARYICDARLREIVRERWPDFVVACDDSFIR